MQMKHDMQILNDIKLVFLLIGFLACSFPPNFTNKGGKQNKSITLICSSTSCNWCIAAPGLP